MQQPTKRERRNKSEIWALPRRTRTWRMPRVSRSDILAACALRKHTWNEGKRGPAPTGFELEHVFPSRFANGDYPYALEFKKKFGNWWFTKGLSEAEGLNLLVYLMYGASLTYLKTTNKDFDSWRDIINLLLEHARLWECHSGSGSFPVFDEIDRATFLNAHSKELLPWSEADKGPEPTREEARSNFPGVYTGGTSQDALNFKTRFREWCAMKKLSPTQCVNLLCYLVRGRPRKLLDTTEFTFESPGEILMVLVGYAQKQEEDADKGVTPPSTPPSGSASSSPREHSTGSLKDLEKRLQRIESIERFRTTAKDGSAGSIDYQLGQIRERVTEHNQELLEMNGLLRCLEEQYKEMSCDVVSQDIEICKLQRKEKRHDAELQVLRRVAEAPSRSTSKTKFSPANIPAGDNVSTE